MSTLSSYYHTNGIFRVQKVKNLIKKINPENGYIFKLKNIDLNGMTTGCSGFITNPANGSTVYLTTEISHAGHFMYRYADNDKDYCGYNNRWDGKNDFNKFIRLVVDALGKTPAEVGNHRI